MKKNIVFGFVGGFIGLSIHLIWHSTTDVELFDFGTHVIQGTILPSIGVIIGILVAKKSL